MSLANELAKSLKDSVICNKCGIKLNWKKSQAIAETKKTKKARLTLRCHNCGNIIGYMMKNPGDLRTIAGR